MIDVHGSGCQPATEGTAASPRLSGDLAMWLVIGMELLAFGLLFIVYPIARAQAPEVFRAGQATLDLHGGARNTALLLTGSWCVARGLEALRRDRTLASARWTWAAAACGAGFIAHKVIERTRTYNRRSCAPDNARSLPYSAYTART